MPEQTDRRRRRRRRAGGLLERIADPEHGFPILRQMIQTFAPMLIEFLMKQLPIWLADLQDQDEDTDTIA